VLLVGRLARKEKN